MWIALHLNCARILVCIVRFIGKREPEAELQVVYSIDEDDQY